MCHGQRCGRENPLSGSCANPRLCPLEQEARAAETRRVTRFYCPECELARRRRHLLAENATFYCADCQRAYGLAELQDYYQGELADLRADAAYIRDLLADLAAWKD